MSWIDEILGSSEELLTRKIQTENSKVPSNYGLCSECEHLVYRKTQLMDEECVCDAYVSDHFRMKTQPRTYDSIIECSTFYKRGQLSLSEMGQIATIIEIKKRKIGFHEVDEVVVTSPRDRKES